MKTTDGYPWMVKFFEEKRNEVITDLIKESGSLTQESLISSNARLQVYEELINFDSYIEKEVIKPKRSTEPNHYPF